MGEEGELSEATVGDSVNVEGVILNSGSAAASLALNCEDVSTNATSQISPSFPNTVIGPGEQAEISFSWRVSVPGDDSISCRILTPTQLVDEFAFGGGQRDSHNIVNWVIADVDDESTIIPALIALAIATSAGGYLLLLIYNGREEDLDE